MWLVIQIGNTTTKENKIIVSWDLFGLRGTLEKYVNRIKKPSTPKSTPYSKLGNVYPWIVIYHTYEKNIK